MKCMNFGTELLKKLLGIFYLRDNNFHVEISDVSISV